MSPGERAAQWRRLLGHLQKDVAKRAHMDISTLCRIEKGNQGVSADQIEAIAGALGLTMPQFYGELRPLPRKAAS